MSTTRIKEKLSQIVGSQLPEFIQNEYPTFVAFIESYYKFIEQDQGAYELLQNAKSYADVDTTIPSFIQYFLTNYAKDIPVSVLADKKILVKKIKDLYESKGSELSFKLLFRIMFDKDVSVRYPYENVLRASDGKWQQKISIRLETVSGDRSNLENKTLRYVSGGILFNTQIEKTKILTSTLIEVFLNPNQIAPSYTLNDNVEVYNDQTLIFVGKIKPTTVDYTINVPGTDFKIGQIFTINFSGGINTLIKITGVNTNGGITSIQFINYGYGYPEASFSIEFDATKNISETSDILTTITQGFGSSGLIEHIFTYNPASPNRYFDTDYVVTDYAGLSDFVTFDNSTYSAPVSFGTTKPESTASISFTVGTIGKYPGSYFKNDGFLSEADVRIEDAALFQPFAYQTLTELDITEFFSFVKLLVHPAGQKLFNNRLVSLDFDFSSNVVISPESNVYFEARDVVKLSDFEDWLMLKNVSAVDNFVEPVDEEDLEVRKPISDNLSTSDVDDLFVNKLITSDVTVTESIDLLQVAGRFFKDEVVISEDFNLAKTSIFNFDDTVSVTANADDTIPNYFGEDYVFEIYEEVIPVFKLDKYETIINNAESTLSITDGGLLSVLSVDPDRYFEELYVDVDQSYAIQTPPSIFTF